MAGHPFVLGLTHGTLPAVALRTWVQQDRIFVLEERRVVAAPVWEMCWSGQAWPG
jgi:thiaminase